MRWSDEITLIHAHSGTDSAGFAVQADGQRTVVFANKKSVAYGQYFKAKEAGVAAELIFEVYAWEYDGQRIVEHQGRRYRVERDYADQKYPDILQLTVSDLSQ